MMLRPGLKRRELKQRGLKSPPCTQLSVQPVASFHGRIADWVADVRAALKRADRVVFVAGTHGRAERTVELLKDYDVRAVMATDAGDVVSGAVLVAEGWLSKGFVIRLGDVRRATDSAVADTDTDTTATTKAIALRIYVETDIFEEERRKSHLRQGYGAQAGKRSLVATFLSDLRDLKVGDLVVHVDNGIGEFVGLKQIAVGAERDAGVPRAALRGRRQAVRARSSASTWSRSTPAARGRRSTASAAPRGRRPRRASRRPCATWPRSCSSSTPRARPCRATPSPPTRTGRRSSRARSRTS